MGATAISVFFGPPLFRDRLANVDDTPDLERVARSRPDPRVARSVVD